MLTRHSTLKCFQILKAQKWKIIGSFLLATELFQCKCKATQSAYFISHNYDLSNYSSLYGLLFQLVDIRIQYIYIYTNHATYIHICRISCTSSNIYNISILNVPVSHEFLCACCCQSACERSNPFPHDSLRECYGMDM